jgi:hypothetical protein
MFYLTWILRSSPLGVFISVFPYTNNYEYYTRKFEVLALFFCKLI